MPFSDFQTRPWLGMWACMLRLSMLLTQRLIHLVRFLYSLLQSSQVFPCCTWVLKLGCMGCTWIDCCMLLEYWTTCGCRNVSLEYRGLINCWKWWTYVRFMCYEDEVKKVLCVKAKYDVVFSSLKWLCFVVDCSCLRPICCSSPLSTILAISSH